MSVRIRAVACACIIASGLIQLPAFAQMTQNQPLSVEEQVAAQNFNGIDIVGDSIDTPRNTGNSSGLSSGQSFNQNTNGNQNSLNNSIIQNTLPPQLNSQNTQLGQVNMFNNNGINSSLNNNSPSVNGMNTMNNGAGGVNAMTQNGFANDMSNGMNNNGGLMQTIGNTVMSDPKLMQRAVGVAGAAALFGLFVGNGGIGGMMRSAGMDNTRHIRGPGGGF